MQKFPIEEIKPLLLITASSIINMHTNNIHFSSIYESQEKNSKIRV
jgi:hypothetical protein